MAKGMMPLAMIFFETVPMLFYITTRRGFLFIDKRFDLSNHS